MMKTDIFIILGLIAGIIIQLCPYFSEHSRFEVMPIFTPVSLQYENAYQEGKKPKTLPNIIQILENIDQQNLDPTAVEVLKKERIELLKLRNERHDLNIKMMENSISLLSDLTPEQWDFIQSNRDKIQSKIELDILEQVLQELPR